MGNQPMQRIIFAAIVCLLLICPLQILAIGLPPGTQIQLQATGQYTNIFDESQTATPDTLILTVLQVARTSINWDVAQDESTQGQYIYIPVKVFNTGNGPDTFNLTTASDSGWASDLIYDENNDGVHDDLETQVITDTSQMVSDGYCPCLLRVFVPEDATEGDVVTVTSTSQYDPAQGTASIDVNVPEPGMISTKIEATANPTSATVGQTVIINGEFHPAASKQLDILITSPNASTASNVTTGDDGTFSISFKAEVSGTYDIDIDFAGDEEYDAATTTISVPVAEKTTSSISLACDPESPTVNDTVTLTGILSPAASAVIDVTCTMPSGSSTQEHVTADANGNFSLSKTLDAAGIWYFEAEYAGDEQTAPCSNILAVQVIAASDTEHGITMSQPLLAPSEVESQGSTQCSVSAADSEDYQVSYIWSDGGAGGSFDPSDDVQSPVYTAPENTSGQDLTVTLTCTATCVEDSQISNSASAALTVHSFDDSAPYVVSVTPASNAQCVNPASNIVIRFSKVMDASSVESAVLVMPGLAYMDYTWSVDGKTLTISHPDFTLRTDYVIRVLASAQDQNAIAMEQDYVSAFSTVDGIWFDPGTMVVETNKQFTTSAVMVDASELTEISMTISIPDGVDIDDTMAGDSLACVEIGDDASSITSSWDSSTREINITAQIASQSSAAEVVKGITLTSPSSQGTAQLSINGCAGLILTIEPPLPGDFNSDHAVNITDAADFVTEWVRWHGDNIPEWSQVDDGRFDLAPRTNGVWPDWTATGDQVIDIQDAVAFIDCWIGSHSQSQTSACYVSVNRCNSSIRSFADREIAVTVDYAPSGVFEVSVPLPDGAWFSSVLDNSGNLKNVIRGSGSGGMVFSEYDALNRTVRLAGSVSGLPPYAVAVIRLGR
jgi:hypothetical protein